MADLDLQLTRSPNTRECATLLAALRYWQNGITDKFGKGSNVPRIPADLREHFLAENVEPLTSEEIDSLCEDINLQPMPESTFPSDDEGTLAVMSTQQHAERNGARCPWCKSNDIEGEQFDVEERGAFQPIHCRACLRNWTDVYQLVGFQPPR